MTGSSDDKFPESPLPPGADLIASQLNDIAHEVFNTDESQNVVGDLTLFGTEDANTSFETSPPVVIDEFEDEVTGTPRSPLKILTPIPSPTNNHRNCQDAFCPVHDHWTEALVSLPSISSAGSVSEPDTSPVPRRKKRKQCKSSWSEVERKRLTNLGKKYVSKRGKIVNEKVMGDPCTCRYKCVDKITHEQRLDCFSRFWSLGTKEKQWAFVVKFTLKVKKYRCLNSNQPNMRKFTYKYNLPIRSTSDNSTKNIIPVCKTMFLNTLSVSERIVQTAFKKFDGVSDVDIDRRGRHTNHNIVIDREIERSVCDHVHSFAPVESHYIRQRSNKLYLDGNLSVARMFSLYKEWFDVTKYTKGASTERQYRDIVSKHFNLGFHVPKKDACDTCHIHRNKNNCTETAITLYEKHIHNKNLARKLKNDDKNTAIHSDGKIIAAVFDFQKVLSCPQGQISIFYYKRKLSCFNFTIFDMGRKQGTCYIWDETISKRGANEVSSCLLDFVKENANNGVEEFRFWSDNCAGQNRNRIVYYFYMYAAKMYNVSITHRFLEKGHTQNEGDSVHALIERVSKSRIIYTPDEWRALVRWAKTDNNPYKVKNMQQNCFFDFKHQVTNKLWNKNSKNEKIQWNQIKEVRVNKNETNKLYYKYDHNEIDNYDCLIVGSSTRNSSSLPLLKPISNALYKISKDKYNDLIHMCNSGVIISEHTNYFKSLPFHNNLGVNNNDSVSDDE